MAHIKCPCGRTLSNSGDAYNGGILDAAAANYVSDGNAALWDEWKETWECPECGRLAVFDLHADPNIVKWYLPEDGKPGHILKGANPC